MQNILAFFYSASSPLLLQKQREINHSLTESEAKESIDLDATTNKNNKNNTSSQKDVDRNNRDNSFQPLSTQLKRCQNQSDIDSQSHLIKYH